jgi:AcrR family transcriptional regulator
MGKKAGLTKDDVIGAAIVVVDRHGLDGLTVSRVAAELGIRPPSIYHHIDGLDGLRHEVAVVGVRRLAERFQEHIDGHSGLPALRELAVAFREFAHDHPGLYEAAQPATSLDADLALYEAAPQAFDAVVAEMSSLGLPPEDQVDVIRSIRAGLHGFIALERRPGFGHPEEVDHSFERMLDLFEGGIRDLLATREAAGRLSR